MPSDRRKLGRTTARVRFFQPALLAVAIGVSTLAMAAGCGRGVDRAEAPGGPSSSARPTIAVTNAALEYFARRLAGDFARIEFPLPPDVDPAYWKPSDEGVRSLQAAELIVINGAGYEHWLDKVTLPRARIVDTSAGFRDQWIRLQGVIKHRHGPSGEHVHAGLAVGTWLDPDLAIRQAESVYRELVRRYGAHQRELDAHWKQLESDLRRWRHELDAVRRAHPKIELWASHPVYAYLAEWTGWHVESVHWEPHEMPDDASWAEFDRRRRAHPASIMLWEDQPIAPTRKGLDQRGVTVVVVRPCGNRPAAGDWLSEMRANTKRLNEALHASPQPKSNGSAGTASDGTAPASSKSAPKRTDSTEGR